MFGAVLSHLVMGKPKGAAAAQEAEQGAGGKRD
jgi:hypothetical protein